MTTQHRNQQLGHEEISDQNQHGRSYYGLRGGPAYTLRSAARSHSVIASYRRDDEPEQSRFQQPHENVFEDQNLPRIVPVLASVQAEEQLGDHQTARQSHEIRNNAQEEQHENRRRHPRRDQFLHWIGAQRAHGIDLLGHHHRPKFASHTGRIPSGNHQAREHRPEFADHGSRNESTNQGDGAETLKSVGGLQGQYAARKKSSQHDEWERAHSDQIRLLHHVCEVQRLAHQVGDGLSRQQSVFLNR